MPSSRKTNRYVLWMADRPRPEYITIKSKPKLPLQSVEPLSINLQQACALSGLKETTFYDALNDGRLERASPPGVHKTLIVYASFKKFILGNTATASRGVISGTHSGTAKRR